MPKKSFRLQRLEQYRFVSVSLAVHLLLIAALGGVVLFQVREKNEFFIAEQQPFLSEAGEEAGTEEAVEEFAEPEFAEPNSAPSEHQANPGDLAQASAITSLTEMGTSSLPALDMQSFGTALGSRQLTGNLTVGETGGKSGGASRGSGMPRTLFGSVATANGQGLIGTFFDLRKDPQGKALPAPTSGLEYLRKCEKILNREGELNPAEIGKYFQAKGAIQGSMFLMPTLPNDSAPRAFNVETIPGHQMWLVRYSGKLVPPKPGRYRFVGGGDELLIVRVNGKLVLDGTWQAIPWEKKGSNPTGWTPNEDSFPGPLSDTWKVGDWVSLNGPFDLEICIGEGWGGLFSAVLTVEEQGKKYKNGPRPLFKVKGYEEMLSLAEGPLAHYKENVTLDGPVFLPAGQ